MEDVRAEHRAIVDAVEARQPSLARRRASSTCGAATAGCRSPA
jgi:DNA-binding FadR family transcriptional regulator